MRTVVYISGPLSNGGTLGPDERRENVVRALGVYRELDRLGYAPVCPHTTEACEILWGMRLEHATWIEIDRAIVSKMDALLRMPGHSSGADEEVAQAMRCNVPVFHTIQALKDWSALQDTADYTEELQAK